MKRWRKRQPGLDARDLELPVGATRDTSRRRAGPAAGWAAASGMAATAVSDEASAAGNPMMSSSASNSAVSASADQLPRHDRAWCAERAAREVAGASRERCRRRRATAPREPDRVRTVTRARTETSPRPRPARSSAPRSPSRPIRSGRVGAKATSDLASGDLRRTASPPRRSGRTETDIGDSTAHADHPAGGPCCPGA